MAAPQVGIDIAGKATPLTQGEQIAVRAPTNGDKAMKSTRPSSCSSATASRRPSAVGTISGPGHEARSWSCWSTTLTLRRGRLWRQAMTYYGRWTYKYEEGARQGAKGVLVIHETEPASCNWATVKNSNTNAMFDIVRKNPREVHPLLEGWIQRPCSTMFTARHKL
jgi:hypothetical protein